MARPTGIEGVPPGLEYLTQVDQILVHQQVEMFEGLSQLALHFTTRHSEKNINNEKSARRDANTAPKIFAPPQTPFPET